MSRTSLATVELSLRMPLPEVAPAPEVRLLVDLESSRSLHAETEVVLQLDRQWLYRGSFEVAEGSASSLLYRLGICAAPGTLWTLRIRDAQDRWLLRDADTLDAPKSWLVGSCPLGNCPLVRTVAHAPVSLLDDYRRRRAGGAGSGRFPG